MKRLVALLLVCVLALSSTLALADENEISTFTPELVQTIAESQGYTKPSDWTAYSYTRAVFSVLVYLDYLSASSSSSDVDWDKTTYVFENDNTLGFAYCNEDGAYKMLLYFPDLEAGTYSQTNSYENTPAEIKKMLEMTEYTVYENSAEDMVSVMNTIANSLE